MDLSNLNASLDPDVADAERDIGDKFRAAAASITSLYRSSLAVTKQGYNAGYSTALKDMLSMVQSSIGEGQDSAQTLSRLMDWADARQAAISVFAADEAEDTPPPRPRSNPIGRQSHLAPNRPSSAPAFERSGTNSNASSMNVFIRSTVEGADRQSESSTPRRPMDTTTYQPTPNLLSSPLNSPSVHPSSSTTASATGSLSQPSSLIPITKPSRGQPIRNPNPTLSHPSQSANPPSSSLTSSTFNPSLPPLPIISSSAPLAFSSSGPAQNYPIGSKRPIIENMEVEIPSDGSNAFGPSFNSNPGIGLVRAQSQRSVKRRSMGLRDGGKEGKDEEEKSGGGGGKKGGRRHGHGHGGASAGV
ncbi:hypothetical protein LQV05_001207 [Cryptococcus neoformans]|nr:hypothetical protein J007_02040 [Cryptococcus neoformans var. grubii]OXC62495.1 hypothetical protein C358_02105 [Cryptococcus neoformans var. grubii MW-RSA852]UOH84407.1 hypothetical protein LQV05_001207 [Cryptococcus neoformans]